ncbi:Mov34/MPN/PAD-1 family protein [Alicyclobacillus acidiphilus]|uniref:Mov34/MPN/PAD-1 family protein n=1 Tax=Alicyclobacillus acidiphilus TaxID=182455 RepID=UPI0008363C16|nr:Mov34/MPN/PAD-1 family protein [Alicyclobacillus acidiphilus]
MWNESRSVYPAALLAALVDHAIAAWPNECVGLVVSRGDRAWAIPLPAAASPTQVWALEDWLISTLYSLEDAGIPILAAYHSHPGGLAAPSEADVHFAATARDHILLVKTNGTFIPKVFTWTADLK